MTTLFSNGCAKTIIIIKINPVEYFEMEILKIVQHYLRTVTCFGAEGWQLGALWGLQFCATKEFTLINLISVGDSVL